MANPQKENGFTAIANELMEALAKRTIPPEKRRVLDVIFRMTYGYRRPEAKIAGVLFEEISGIDRRRVYRSVNWLEQVGMITVTRAPKGRGSISTYAIQKDYEQWDLSKNASQQTHIKMRHFDQENASPHTAENASQQTHTKAINQTKTKDGSASACLESQASPSSEEKHYCVPLGYLEDLIKEHQEDKEAVKQFLLGQGYTEFQFEEAFHKLTAKRQKR